MNTHWRIQFEGDSILIMRDTPTSNYLLRVPLEDLTIFTNQLDEMLSRIACIDLAEGPIDSEWTTD